MIKLTEERLSDVLKYMEDDLANCLYLYGDIVRYGLNDPNMTVWFSEKDGAINAVVMKYFSGSHVYSKHLDYDLEEVLEKLLEIHVDRISSQREIIEALQPRMSEEFDVEYGCVFKLTKYREMKSPVVIERAKAEDADAIAELLMTNETFSSTYEKKALAEELADRIEKGIGRSYIIRDGERIVGHDCVSLETDTYIVKGLSLVHDDFRNTLYGAFLESHGINEPLKEGKEVYAMLTEGRRLDGFIRMGNIAQANYGKLFRKGL